MLKTRNVETRTKALSFELKPIGATGKLLEQYKKNEGLIAVAKAQDELRPLIKKVLDKFYKEVIAKWLTKPNIAMATLIEAYNKYMLVKEGKKEEKAALDECITKMQKTLLEDLKAVQVCGSSGMDSAVKLFEGALQDFAKGIDYETYSAVESLRGKGAFYDRFVKGRQLLFDENKVGSVCNRVFAENMPIYFDNILILNEIRSAYPDLYNELQDVVTFVPELYMDFATQVGIDAYNKVIADCNVATNLYSQKNKVNVKKLKKLNKQMLFEVAKAFEIESIESEEELINITEDTYTFAKEKMEEFAKLSLELLTTESLKQHLILKEKIHSLSFEVFGRHDLLSQAIDYKKESILKAKDKKAFEKREGFTCEELVTMLTEYLAQFEDDKTDAVAIYSHFKYLADALIKELNIKYNSVKPALDEAREGNYYNRNESFKLREFYDASIEIRQRFKYLINGDISSEINNEVSLFVADYSIVVKNYNLARNYVTKKPYSTHKFPVDFGYSNFGVGDSRYLSKSGSFLLEKDGKVYLAVIDRAAKIKLESLPICTDGNEECYQMTTFYQLTGIYKQLPRILLANRNTEKYKPTAEIRDIIKNKKFKADKECLVKYITFAVASLKNDSEYSHYNLDALKEPEEYENISDFYNDLEYCMYSLGKLAIPVSYIEKQNEEGNIYLFQIYSKDFSEAHRGKDGIQKKLILSLFDDENIKANTNGMPHTRIKGGTKIFFRPASIPADTKPTHPAGVPMTNKNPLNPRKTRTLPYDLYKDKRYMSDKLLVSILVEAGAVTKDNSVNTYNFNREVNKIASKKNVLTIVRGNTNLIYYTVSDPKGNVLEQGNLDVITSKYADVTITVDYNALLTRREAEYKENQTNWMNDSGIKNLKNGYLSVVLGEIAKLRDKYDAIVCVENVSFGKQRSKIEKQLYAGFESTVIKKFGSLWEKGSVMRQYCLEDNRSIDGISQNGYVYIINPTYTNRRFGKYTDRLSYKFKYTNFKNAISLLSKFDKIWLEGGTYYATFSYRSFGEDKLRDGTEVTDHKFKVALNEEWTYYNGKKYVTISAGEEVHEVFTEYGLDASEPDFTLLDAKGARRLLEVLRAVLSCKTYNEELAEWVVQCSVVEVDGEKVVKQGFVTEAQLRCKNMTEKLRTILSTVDEDGTVVYNTLDWIVA